MENHNFFSPSFNEGQYGLPSAAAAAAMYATNSSSSPSLPRPDYGKTPMDYANVLQQIMNISTQSLDEAQTR